MELKPCAWDLAVGSGVMTLSHLGSQQLRIKELCLGMCPPASLPDANSIGGAWIMPKEWINLLTDTQTWMLFYGSFYKGRWSDLSK